MTDSRIGTPLHSEPEPRLSWIEVASTLQLPQFVIVGLPGPEVSEARERVRAAVGASGLAFPKRRVVLNLSPASVRKQGTGMDLAMALAVLLSEEDRPRAPDRSWVASGELGLDGTVKPAGRVARALLAAWLAGATDVLLAPADAAAAPPALALIRAGGPPSGAPPPRVHSVPSLARAWEALKTGAEPGPLPAARAAPPAAELPSLLPLAPGLERMIGAAASGAHHLLLVGPRGTGKSYAVEWLIAAQPEPDGAVELGRMLLAELGDPRPASGNRGAPVRRISPQARPAALIGSASVNGLSPGEFSLAHGGLLVADELPEWARDAREALREPMERGKVTLTRRDGRIELSARFVLAANGNLCPCGGWPPETCPPAAGEPLVPCRCSPTARTQYLNRLSGPVLDRIDLVCRLGMPPAGPVSAEPETAAPERLRAAVSRARAELVCRYGGLPGRLEPARLEELLRDRRDWARDRALLEARSLRSRHKILRVALTLAAWDGLVEPGSAHFAEAALYRPERILR